MFTIFRAFPSIAQWGDDVQQVTSAPVAPQDSQAHHTALGSLTPAPVRGTRTGSFSLKATASQPHDLSRSKTDGLGVDRASAITDSYSYVDIIPPETKHHILYGNASGSGGHLWPGRNNKTAFPRSWGADKIIHEIGDITTSPNTTWYTQTGTGEIYTRRGDPAKWVAFEVRGGVRIRVVYQPAIGKVITAFPDDTPMPPLKETE